MTKLYSLFISIVLWMGLGVLDVGFAQSDLILNQDVPQEYCSVTPSGQRFCEAVQSQYTKSVGAPAERCTTSAQGQVTCEWQPAPMQSCIVISSGRHICNEIKPVESPHSNENMICTNTPQGTACVSRNPPSINSCANVRCAGGHSCVETSTGPQCVADAPPKLTCANALCSEGHRCIESATGPQCVPFEERTLTCANALCTADHKCIESATGPQCVPDQPNVTPWDRRICPAHYDPVCGQKGHLKRTFGNDCEARRANYDILYKGVCRFAEAPPLGNIPCPQIWDPVCGQKGNATRSFGNSCEAARDHYEILYKGECRAQPAPVNPPQICPYIYAPVCAQKGSDRRSFSNDCVARSQGYAIISNGDCSPEPTPLPPHDPEQIMCPMIYQPVCGQKGFERKTFGNRCEAARSNYSIIYEGRCR